MPKEQWRKGSSDSDYVFVKENYIPAILNARGNLFAPNLPNIVC
jgi:hypothetical protein